VQHPNDFQGNPVLNKPPARSRRVPTDRLQRLAGEPAERQARRTPWQRLFESRNQYIDWQEFYLWVRSILEVELGVPDWLGESAQCDETAHLVGRERKARSSSKLVNHRMRETGLSLW
jgi:hypothetical protein